MPLLKRRTATTTDDGRPWCRYCHVAVTLDAHGCCELGHRVMSPEDAAVRHAHAEVATPQAAASAPDHAEGQAPDAGTGEEDLESLIAAAARAETEPGTHGEGQDFEGEYREDSDPAHALADELDSLWDAPSAGAPTASPPEHRESAPTEAFSALHDAPTEPLGSSSAHAPTTRLDAEDGGDDASDGERAAAHARVGHQHGESALDDLLDFGDDRA